MEKQVVVGVDGSPDACRAVRWAAAEAVRRGAPLHVVHAWVWPLYKVPLGPAPGAPPGAGLQAQADRVLADAAAEAGATAPGLQVETSLVTGDAASRLIAASREASLLVLGNRGLGGFAGLLLGSVGLSAVSHASCPVVIVRGRPDPTGPVLVGVDGPQGSQHTIETGFAAARRLSTGVLALHCFVVPPRHEATTSYRDHLVAAEEDARAIVDQELAGARARYPDVPVQVRLGDGPAARELVVASEVASLVVVGSRGSGGFAALALGTTSHALVHHADCPVMVSR